MRVEFALTDMGIRHHVYTRLWRRKSRRADDYACNMDPYERVA